MKSIDNSKTMLQCIHVQPVSDANEKPNKVDTMSDNAKFVTGIGIILTIAALGFVLIAAYFDVLVK